MRHAAQTRVLIQTEVMANARVLTGSPEPDLIAASPAQYPILENHSTALSGSVNVEPSLQRQPSWGIPRSRPVGLLRQGSDLVVYQCSAEAGNLIQRPFFATLTCPADMDCNGEVAPADLAALLGSWGQCPGYPADVNGDGEVRPKHAHCFTREDGKQDRADWVTNEFARIVKRAGIAHCSLHDLRRSLLTLAQRAGIDKATAKNLGDGAPSEWSRSTAPAKFPKSPSEQSPNWTRPRR